MGWVLHCEGKDRDAEPLLRQALAARRKSPDEGDAVAVDLQALGIVLLAQDRRADAEPLLRETFSIRLSLLDGQISNDPADAALYAERGHIRARGGDLAGAIADYSAAIDRQPDDDWCWYLRAVLRLEQGDTKGFAGDCVEMRRRFDLGQPPEVAERVAKLCMLMPSSSIELADLRPRLDRALRAESPSHMHWAQITRGIYEYRLGRYPQAISWLAMGREGIPKIMGRALADYFLAMAHQRTGRTADAQRLLDAAEKMTPHDATSAYTFEALDAGSAVGSWAVCQIVRREAEDLIRGKAATAATPLSPR